MEFVKSVLENKIAVTILVIVFAPVFGALLSGIDRKISARMQLRKGPPLLQPFYDIFKLCGKEPIALHRPQIAYAVLHLVFMILTVGLLVQGRDLLMILFVHAFSAICLVLGGMSVRSPYSWIGSMRKTMQILAYEPVLVLLILAVYLKTGSFLGKEVIAEGTPLIYSMPLLFLAFVCVVAIEFEKSPFDIATSHHAHQEIVKGITVEYSGPFLALVEIAHYYEIAMFFGLLTAFWHTCLIGGVLLACGSCLFLLVLDNTFSRLSPYWMVRFMWTVPLALSLANLVWLWR